MTYTAHFNPIHTIPYIRPVGYRVQYSEPIYNGDESDSEEEPKQEGQGPSKPIPIPIKTNEWPNIHFGD